MNGRRLAAVFLILILLSLGMPCRLLAHGQGEEGDGHHQMATEGHGHEDAQLAPPVIAGRDWVEEKTGLSIPLDLTFLDEEGKGTSLGDIIDRPILLMPIYYYCPSACSRNLANLAVALSRLTALPGRDFRVIAFSFNEKETADDARRAKINYLKLAGKDFPEKEWRFLTGDRESIATLTASLGYRFQKSGDGTYVHPAAVVAIAGDGKIIRYVYGDFIPGDIDQAVADAAKGTPSFSVKRFLGMCFNTDPAAAGKGIFQTVKVAMMVAFVLAIAAFLFFLRRRGRRATEKRTAQE
jgi:protein SCO1/2